MSKQRKFRGFVMMSVSGHQITSTDKPTREKSLEAFKRYNPNIDPEKHGIKLMKYTKILEEDHGE